MRDVPRGLKTLLYGEAALKGQVERDTLALFERWGYCRVETPSMEFLHILAKGLDAEALKRVITFTDPAGGGKPLALRPDVTPQIARIAATSLAGRPSPHRFCYVATVYRSAAPGAGNRMEQLQAGVELIGAATPSADSEVIALSMEAISALNLKGAKIAISHLGYIKSIIDGVKLNTGQTADVMRALSKKDAKGLNAAIEKAGAKGAAAEALKKIPSLIGGVTILEKAPAVNDGSRRALDELRTICGDLEKYNAAGEIVIDLGETRGFGYYTGVTFEGFVKGIGKSVLSGGRYDELLSMYGEGKQATGFAMNLNAILEYLGENAGNEWSVADMLLTCDEASCAESILLASRLRGEKGLKVLRDILFMKDSESAEYAKKFNIPNVVSLNSGQKGSAKVIHVPSGKEYTTTIEALIASNIVHP